MFHRERYLFRCRNDLLPDKPFECDVFFFKARPRKLSRVSAYNKLNAGDTEIVRPISSNIFY